MKFLRFCPDIPRLELDQALEVHAKMLGGSVETVAELPKKTGMHEVLCLCFKELTLKNLEPLTQSTYQYLAFVEGAESTEIPVILRTGGNIFQRSEIKKDSDRVNQGLRAIIENMKLKDLAYHLSVKELTLLRRIYGLVKADKKKLGQEIYGASSETTLDVNLARLRKKIADPKVGEDFFRIVTHKRMLYLVSAINDYKFDNLIDVFEPA